MRTDEQQPDCFDFDFALTDHPHGSGQVQGICTREAPVVILQVAVFADQAQASEAFDRVASQDLVDCLVNMKEQSDDGVRVMDVSGGELSFPPFGARSSMYQVAIKLEIQDARGFEPTCYADLGFILEDRTLSLLFFLDAVSSFPDPDKAVLMGSVDRKGADCRPLRRACLPRQDSAVD
jgi:hypothetical protein